MTTIIAATASTFVIGLFLVIPTMLLVEWLLKRTKRRP